TRRVAIRGAIMPAPFPKAATVTRRPPSRRRRTAVFGNASVVVIACAAAGKPSGLRAAAAARTPRSNRARGTWTPIRPVAQGATSSSGTPRRRPTSAVATLAVRSPSRPVHAFAFPACTSTAESRPPTNRRRAGGAVAATSAGGTPARGARPPSRRGPGADMAPPAPRRAPLRPVALLELLPAPARTRVVPPHLVAVAPHGLDLLGLRLLAVREGHTRGLPLAALHRFELRRERVLRSRGGDGRPLGPAGG